MIVIDSSALLAIVQGEVEAGSCRAAIAANDELLIAAPTLAEVLIVASRRGLRNEVSRLVRGLALTVVPLTEARAHDAVRHYERWGKGFDKAQLNFGDAFAYAIAHEHDCPLLFVGDDFAQTDVRSALL